MKMQKRHKSIIKNTAGTGLAAIILAAAIPPPAVSAMPAPTAHRLAPPPTTGDCTACHPKPTKPKRNN